MGRGKKGDTGGMRLMYRVLVSVLLLCEESGKQIRTDFFFFCHGWFWRIQTDYKKHMA